MNDSNIKILSVDIGTTAFKMCIFKTDGQNLSLVDQYVETCAINSYNGGLYGDIDPEKWLAAFRNGCSSLTHILSDVQIISLSGTTPGLTAMDKNGDALYPAILMLDQRSREQAQFIIDVVGMDFLLEHTGNMPVAGGCSLASILWLKENMPDVWKKTCKFAHSNTFFGHWLTGRYAIDPSSASLSALYNTVKNDMSWNKTIADACDVPLHLLPDLVNASESIGRLKADLARELGLNAQPHVLIGGNDAVLAAYSAGVQSPGDVMNVNGTCEITLVCLSNCLPSKNYNVRAHVLPNRWLTLHVLNAGGKAYEWFKNLFCREMTDVQFYNHFVPESIDAWLDKESAVEYVPYLMGSRYSLNPLKAELKGLTAEVSRSEVLAALTKGLCLYQKKHVAEIQQFVHLNASIKVTGGALSEAIIRAKQKWYWETDYVFVEQSSLTGAALLGLDFLENKM